MINDRDMVELSTTHAYGNYKRCDKFEVNGSEYEVVEVYNESNGMKYGTDAMLVKGNDSYALIYTGSDRNKDFFKDWILNNGANALKLDVVQYKEGNELYQNLSSKYNVEAVGGVSLGGGVATYVGINNKNVRAVCINPSPQVCNVGTSYNNVLTIVDKNDILFNVSKNIGRRDNYPSNIVFFDRGNSFIKNIAFNHIGYNKELSLDDRMPFDLLTNNCSNNIINVDVDDISTINKNFSTFYNNLNHEISLTSLSQIRNIVVSTKNEIKYNKILNEVIIEVKNYMKNTLPTLYSYLEFESFFYELEHLIKQCSFEVVDNVLYTIVKELNLDRINQQLQSDSNLVLNNLVKINNCTLSNINGCEQLITSIKSVDEGGIGIVSNVSTLHLNKGSVFIKLNYMHLLENAKNCVYNNLRFMIRRSFYTVDQKIDSIIFTLKTSVGILADVTKIISKEISRKFEVIETILQELYVFNISDLVYITIISLIDELVSIVVVKDIDDKIFAFKSINSSLESLVLMYRNYKGYLASFSSHGFTKLGINFDNITQELQKFNFHLKYIYK